MKIRKVAYENAPPYVSFLPKWGFVRLYRIKILRRSVREVICTWRLRSWHFFPRRSSHGPTRGWYGNVADTQSTIKGFLQLYFMSKFLRNIFFSKWCEKTPKVKIILILHTSGTYMKICGNFKFLHFFQGTHKTNIWEPKCWYQVHKAQFKQNSFGGNFSICFQFCYRGW